MKTCPNNHNNPDEALYCRGCGHRFEETTSLPFHMAHPEYHLRPFSEFDKDTILVVIYTLLML